MLWWPTRNDLGNYYDVWLKMTAVFVIAIEYFEGVEWFEQLYADAWRAATCADGVVDMVAFYEFFYHGMAFRVPDIHAIVRDCNFLF